MNAPARLPGSALSAAPAGPILRLQGVRKAFKGGTVAVESVDLDIARGEFFTLLGPSGSGKTTTLRLIAGFETPDAGRIDLDGVDVARIPPFERNINTVFQDYALFPHLSVADNVAYGLRAKRVPAPECRERVAEALRSVQLTDYGGRLPSQLSGGQKQRVGLARAIVNRPGLLLLDEPLGALDLKLRHAMQLELKHLQEQLGITFLYVTHDQEEALSMSTRIAIFNRGRVEQVGTPSDIYRRPATAFVAGFVGHASLIERGGRRLVLRPETVAIGPPGPCPEGLHAEAGRLEDVVFVGMFTRYLVRLADGAKLEAVRPSTSSAAGPEMVRGDAVTVAWDPAEVWALT